MKLKLRHTDVDALHRIDVSSGSLPRHVPAGNTIVCHQMSLDLDQLTHICRSFCENFHFTATY